MKELISSGVKKEEMLYLNFEDDRLLGHFFNNSVCKRRQHTYLSSVCFKYLGYKKGDMPNSERAADEVFSIPVYPELTKWQLSYVAEIVRKGLRIND